MRKQRGEPGHDQAVSLVDSLRRTQLGWGQLNSPGADPCNRVSGMVAERMRHGHALITDHLVARMCTYLDDAGGAAVRLLRSAQKYCHMSRLSPAAMMAADLAAPATTLALSQ